MHLINSFWSHIQPCAHTRFGSSLPSSWSSCVPHKLPITCYRYRGSLRGTQELPKNGKKLLKHVGAQGWMCDFKVLIRCTCWFFYEFLLITIVGRVVWSVRRQTKSWMVRGLNPGGGEIFHTCPDWPWGLLYNGYWVFAGGKVAGAWCWPPTPF
jgi:hypothetical protein